MGRLRATVQPATGEALGMARTRLCVAGHVATAGELIAMGASRRELSAAVDSGRLIRLRQGVYACPHVHWGLPQFAMTTR
jgi:hypothetical protein